MFKTPIRKLNVAKPYVFFNRGLIAGVIGKKEVKTGKVKYYTSDYGIFTNYTKARHAQLRLNAITA